MKAIGDRKKDRTVTPIVFLGYVSSRNSDGFPDRGRPTTVEWENKLFSSFMRQNLESGMRYVQRKLLLMTNRI